MVNGRKEIGMNQVMQQRFRVDLDIISGARAVYNLFFDVEKYSVDEAFSNFSEYFRHL